MTPEQQKIEDDKVRALILETKLGCDPGRLSEIMVQLSGHYATLAQELEDNAVFMADKWLELRSEVKSDSMATRLWDSTPEGKRLTRLKIQTRYIEKIISSIKMRLRVKEGESFGRF